MTPTRTIRALTDGERCWMEQIIADGLRKLGIDVTPRTMERELQHMDTTFRTAAAGDAGDFTPPDPYAAGLEKLRGPAPAPPSAPAKDATPPRSYDAALDKLRKQESR